MITKTCKVTLEQFRADDYLQSVEITGRNRVFYDVKDYSGSLNVIDSGKVLIQTSACLSVDIELRQY